MKTIQIAIDGPAGAGKSTISKTLAKELGYMYIDTGALYRTVGLHVYRKNIGLKETERMPGALSDMQVEMKYVDGQQHVLLCGEDVTGLIRTPEMSMYASAVSAVPQVRQALLDMQRQLAQTYDVIMDGRDIGTVVLPQAQIKIFLTATPEDRAQRRYLELQKKDPSIRFEDVLADLIERDHNDSTRAIAPLRPAEDAILVDTTGCTLEQAVQKMLDVVKERLQHV